MDNTKLLKEIFNLANKGIYIKTSNLPKDISKEVVEKNLLYIELKNLVKNNGDKTRIAEIKELLAPKEEGVNE